MHRGILRNIFVVGVPSALQLAITSFSNVFVQSYVNRFASSCMAGWAAYQKIDAFVILPMTTLSVTATTFVGQNVGAGELGPGQAGDSLCPGHGHGGDGGPFGPADGLCPAPVHPVQPGAGGAGVRGVFYPPDLPLLSGWPTSIRFTPGPAGGGGRQGAHGDHAGVLCGLPAALSLCHLQVAGTLLPVALGYPVGWVVCSGVLLWYYRSGRWMAHSLVTPAGRGTDRERE